MRWRRWGLFVWVMAACGEEAAPAPAGMGWGTTGEREGEVGAETVGYIKRIADAACACVPDQDRASCLADFGDEQTFACQVEIYDSAAAGDQGYIACEARYLREDAECFEVANCEEAALMLCVERLNGYCTPPTEGFTNALRACWPNTLTCPDDTVIFESWICDGDADCRDAWDESNCS